MNTQDSSSRFAPSARLGPFEILGPIGKGGMGEVYRAKDTRLDREVAIKVLPPGLGNDEQFRARFEREAKSVSALNHPHICTLHDVGQETVKGETIHYLVLELIEGESLSARIGRAPLSLDEVLLHGKQIASALDAAHKRGIIHRDLKPGNVMITRSGAKLLDFGLAKAGERGAVQGIAAIETHDTIDKPLTEQGTIMGTFQYMSPEQLEGAPADARTDIFALGAVLYEMATGKKAFEGKNRTSLIAAIVSSHPPPISTVQAMSPPALDHVIRKCIEKDPDDRWQSARDVAAELQWISEGGSRAGLPAAVSSRRRHREGIAWSAAAVFALTALGFGIAWSRRTPVLAPVGRFVLPNPGGLTSAGPPSISPDGRVVAFDAIDQSGTRQLWIRPLDALEARPVPGTEGARRPIWSPDSRFLAFRADGKLRRVALSGGPAQTICDLATASDGTWNSDGVILLDGQPGDPIWRVDASGGAATVELGIDSAKGITFVGWPEFLPDGRHFLYMTQGEGTERSLMVRALGAKEGKKLLSTSSKVAYAAPGFLVYVRDQTLVAHPFDAQKQELSGEPIPIGDGLGVDIVGGASFSLSTNGVLTYRAGEDRNRRLLWMDRSGKETPALAEAREYWDTWLSPDGTRVAFDIDEGNGKGDVWIRDLARGVTSRFTFGAEAEYAPAWSPDGRRIVFSKERKDAIKGSDLYVKDAIGTGEPERLTDAPGFKYASDWSPNGDYLVFGVDEKETALDLWALPLKGADRKPIPLVRTKFIESGGSLSPDGRFLAYRSNESGRPEVYVQEFPVAHSKWQVSTNGGRDPFWRGDGREMFYRANDLSLMAVPVTTAPTFEMGTAQALFKARFPAQLPARSLYRPTRDGQRFLVLSAAATIPPAILVVNWPTALK
ncbi:MAG: protein kinase [Vicinamibacteria bacterium]